MTAPTNNTADTNDTNQVNPSPVPYMSLDDLINQWEKEGLTLELIVALVMSNPEGLGAMDNCSDSIAGIAQQSNILSKVQADVISIDAVLSKIESQLGVAPNKTAINSAWAKNKTALNNEMGQLKQAYTALYGSKGNNGDLAALSQYKNKYPSLSPVIGALKSWQGDFTANTTNTAGNGNAGTFNFADDIKHWGSNSNLKADFEDLGNMHYNANHPNKSSTGTPTDVVSNWWQGGNEAQTLASGQSQQDTTEVQSLMQLLQGFDSDGQQMLQLAATAKTAMIQNSKTA